jgi:hypothetical protein
MEIISVKQNAAGMWVITVDGTFLGDSRPQPTKDAAIAYAKKITAGWPNVEFKF